ncbi:stage II sporulation protein M [Paenibacillus sp. GSMTC-2017]|uniref:stage II sporulation protein M n=1 Tax=Paenibacillus sp. GSMTC-2017 TaxID=2794350 RepID=UPI0018D61241|nr:stage II sporulation protein M [Paenibacillus sp. GSMTC-2017]MBH5318029.1 stage II sporulation protein M [Paenibacillus sp. GSMTC-2017]
MKYHYNLYIFVSVLFVVGGIFGALLVNALTLEQQQELSGEVKQYIQLMDGGVSSNEVDVFWERFFFHFKWLMLIWLLGITVVGIPVILILNFLKGTLIGFSVGVLLQQYAWKGVLFSLVAVAPQNIIAIPALVITSAAAISFGTYIVKNRLLQQKGELLPELGSFTSTTIIMLLIFAGASLFEAYISPPLISWAAPFISLHNGIL